MMIERRPEETIFKQLESARRNMITVRTDVTERALDLIRGTGLPMPDIDQVQSVVEATAAHQRVRRDVSEMLEFESIE